MLVFLIILLCAVLYAVPGLIATGRQHPQAWRIWLVDIFLGFTIVGWLWSLREALRPDAVPYRKVYYRYSYYGGETRKKRFDLRQLPFGDVGMALVGLAVVALAGTFGWQYFAPQPGTAEAAADNPPHGWNYTLDDGAVHVSTLLSNDLDATGDSLPAALVVRNGPGAPSAALRIDGQFTCSAATNGTVTAQFDGRTETLHCAPRPASLSDAAAPGQDLLFIADPETFIARARRARSLVVTAGVLGRGMKHAHFSPQGLDVAMAGLPEAASAPVARPAEAEAPAVIQPVAATAPVQPGSSMTFEGAKVTRPMKARPVRTAAHTTAHHNGRAAARPLHPRVHYKSWHE